MLPQTFSSLTPDTVFDALDSIGLRGDGRLLALNSYGNRVYQADMEDSLPLVAKFYRPERWMDAAILEEHAARRQRFPVLGVRQPHHAPGTLPQRL